MDTAEKLLSQLCWSRHGAIISRLVSTVVQHLQSSARTVMAGGHLLGIFGARVGAVRNAIGIKAGRAIKLVCEGVAWDVQLLLLA